MGPKVVCTPNRARRVLKLSSLTLGLNRKTQGEILKKLHLRIVHSPSTLTLSRPGTPWELATRMPIFTGNLFGMPHECP